MMKTWLTGFLLLLVGLEVSFGSESVSPIVSFPTPWTSSFRIDSQFPHQIVNEEDSHLFVLAKTAWAYFGCANPNDVIRRAKEQGVNTLRVALEGTPYPDQLGLDLWPWGGTRQKPDWHSFNESYWQQVESRIRLAGDQGIGFDLVLYFTLKPRLQDTENQKFYWQQIIQRLSRYTNILCWEIQNEYLKNESFQDAVGSYFKTNDPYRHPICTSDGTTDDASWTDKSWMDLSIVHTCTGSGEDYDLEHWYLSVARNTRSHGKPAFNNESGREKRHRNDDGVNRRKQGWLWCTAGGFWTWHSWDGCEGIDQTDYQAPGANYLKPMSSFFQSIPFWSLDPNFTACTIRDSNQVFSTLANLDRSLVISYLCTRKSGETVSGEKVIVQIPDGQYRIELIRPSDLTSLQTIPYTSAGLRNNATIALPDFTDDLLIKIVNTTPKEKTLIPGTQ